MADEAQVKKLRTGDVDAWNKWKGISQGFGHKGPKIELESADLANLELSGVHLQGADLSRANLQGANLSHSNFKGAILHESNFREANLFEANLQSELSKADLSLAKLFHANLEGANLSDANLKNADISGNANLKRAHLDNANLQGADLSCANLQEAGLSNANLQAVNLHEANLNKAYFHNACLQDADVSKSDLQESNLHGANLEKADLSEALLNNAVLYKANLKRATLRSASMQAADCSSANFLGADLYDANLQDADLRQAVCIRLDSTFIRNARFSPRAKDPWSILRRTYTGPKFTFQLLALIAFALPYIGNTVFWSAVNRGQGYTQGLLTSLRERAIEQGIDDWTIIEIGLSQGNIVPLSQCLSEACELRSAWQLLLGTNQSALFWLLPISLIIYNVLRGLLTYVVAPMRDEEERSGYSPPWGEKWWQGYRILFYAHQVVFALGFIALGAFAFNAWRLFKLPIYIPA